MSMLLPPFELHEPTSIKEALALKAAHPDSDWLAGGTDLLPNYKWGVNTKPHVISLARIAEMHELTATRIGARVTLAQIEKSGLLAEHLPVLPKTARLIATPLLRASGTLGGNLLLENRCFFFNQTYLWRKSKDFCLKADGTQCHVIPQKEVCYATFSADLPASLIALDATLHLASASQGERAMPLRDFYHGDGIERNVRADDELVTHVSLPEGAPQWLATYHKLRLRDSFDFPELGVAAAVKMRGDGAVDDLRLVINAVETTPVILDDLKEHLNEGLTPEAIATVADAATQRVRPVKNTNLPPSYRKQMVGVFTKRALNELASHT